MRITIVFLFLSLVLLACSASDGKSDFGKYYQIATYDIYVPFGGSPNISPVKENDVCKITSYQYAYPGPKDDVNYLYGIDVFQFKTKYSTSDTSLIINTVATERKTMYETVHGGKLVRQDPYGYHGAYSVSQKIKVNVPDIGETYITSLYFLHDELVIREYIFSSKKDDNARMLAFFESV